MSLSAVPSSVDGAGRHLPPRRPRRREEKRKRGREAEEEEGKEGASSGGETKVAREPPQQVKEVALPSRPGRGPKPAVPSPPGSSRLEGEEQVDGEEKEREKKNLSVSRLARSRSLVCLSLLPPLASFFQAAISPLNLPSLAQSLAQSLNRNQSACNLSSRQSKHESTKNKSKRCGRNLSISFTRKPALAFSDGDARRRRREANGEKASLDRRSGSLSPLSPLKRTLPRRMRRVEQISSD